MISSSIKILALQIAGLGLGAFATLYIASNVDAEVFSIYAIMLTVSSLITFASVTGHETHLIRNMLNLKDLEKLEEMRVQLSSALSIRVQRAFLAVPFIVTYVLIVSSNIYQGENVPLLLLFLLPGIANSLLNFFSICMRSLNRHAEVLFIATFFSIFSKGVSLYIFVSFGYEYFLYSTIFLPLLFLIFPFFRLREYIDYSFFLKSALRFQKNSHFEFMVSSYLRYAAKNIDRVLAPIFLDASGVGVYGLFRQMVEIGKKCIEGFFDPMTQGLVRFKGNWVSLKIEFLKVFKIWIVILALCIAIYLVFLNQPNFLAFITSFLDYQRVDEYIFIACAISIFYLMFKPFIDFFSLFGERRAILISDIFVLAISLVGCVLVLIFDVYRFYLILVWFQLGLGFVYMVGAFIIWKNKGLGL